MDFCREHHVFPNPFFIEFSGTRAKSSLLKILARLFAVHPANHRDAYRAFNFQEAPRTSDSLNFGGILNYDIMQGPASNALFINLKSVSDKHDKPTPMRSLHAPYNFFFPYFETNSIGYFSHMKSTIPCMHCSSLC